MPDQRGSALINRVRIVVLFITRRSNDPSLTALLRSHLAQVRLRRAHTCVHMRAPSFSLCSVRISRRALVLHLAQVRLRRAHTMRSHACALVLTLLRSHLAQRRSFCFWSSDDRFQKYDSRVQVTVIWARQLRAERHLYGANDNTSPGSGPCRARTKAKAAGTARAVRDSTRAVTRAVQSRFLNERDQQDERAASSGSGGAELGAGERGGRVLDDEHAAREGAIGSPACAC